MDLSVPAPSVPWEITALARLRPHEGREIGGILGADGLGRYAVEIDYPDGRPATDLDLDEVRRHLCTEETEVRLGFVRDKEAFERTLRLRRVV